MDPLDEESDVLAFAPIDTTYFAKHADSQAIISFAAGSAFVGIRTVRGFYQE